MSRYLVSGCAGFIGARVAGMLLERGDEVCGIDNLCDAYDVRLKQYRLRGLLGQPGFRFIHADIADCRAMQGLDEWGRFDGVINLAARAGVRASVEDPWAFVDTNMTGTLNLLEFCRRSGTEKFILASTSSIYGNDAPHPTPETAASDKPLQPYAARPIISCTGLM